MYAVVFFFSMSVLFGLTTFIWYQNAKPNDPHKITPGVLGVDFHAATEYLDSNNDVTGTIWNLKTTKEPMFDFPLNAAPGYEQTKYLKVSNSGTINLDYFIEFSIIENSILSSAIQFDIQRINSDTSLDFSIFASEITQTQLGGNDVIPNTFDVYKITIKFLETAGNDYNSGDGVLEFKFDVFLYAWESSAGQMNDLQALLETINIIDDYRRFKYVLPQDYIERIKAIAVNNYSVLESRIFKEIISNRPVEGYKTNGSFNVVFNESLNLHIRMADTEHIISTSIKDLTKNDFESMLNRLRSSGLSSLGLKNDNRSITTLINQHEAICSFLDNETDQSLITILNGKRLDGYFAVLDYLTNHIETSGTNG